MAGRTHKRLGSTAVEWIFVEVRRVRLIVAAVGTSQVITGQQCIDNFGRCMHVYTMYNLRVTMGGPSTMPCSGLMACVIRRLQVVAPSRYIQTEI